MEHNLQIHNKDEENEENVCKLCNSTNNSNFNIFGEKGLSLNIDHILTKYIWTHLNVNIHNTSIK